MKKIFKVIITTLLIANCTLPIANAQVPAPDFDIYASYQAVARDVNGNLIANQTVAIRFTIHDATAGGATVYTEVQHPNTNALGLFSVNIGSVTPASFALINWGNAPKFMQVEIDFANGVAFIDMGTQQMMSVPYAKYAEKSKISADNKWTATGSDIYNNNSGNVGIGNNIPSEKLDVNGKTKTTNFQMTNGAATDAVLSSDASGNATWESKVGFAAKISIIQNITGPNIQNTVVFGNELYDYGSSYDPITGIFTAPSAGTYHFDATLHWEVTTSVGAASTYLLVNGLTYLLLSENFPSSSSAITQIVSTDVSLNAGDAVKIAVQQSSIIPQALYGFNIYSSFSAHKLR